MSYYVHKKVIRLPITEYMIRKIGFNNAEDFIEQFNQRVNERCPELYGARMPYFEVVAMDEHPYIDLVLYYFYGEESGYWAIAKYLSDKEKEFFFPYFDKLGISFDPDNFRKVDDCRYNCSEPPDCYDVGDEDDWTLLV